jgi:dolichol-phosphate mannosyltransferase
VSLSTPTTDHPSEQSHSTDADPISPPDPVTKALTHVIVTYAGMRIDVAAAQALAIREAFRDEYRRTRDPIADDRLLWRAQTIRHLVHLVPGQTILELAAGDARFSAEIANVSRGENPITAVSYRVGHQHLPALPAQVKYLQSEIFPGALESEAFDVIVGIDMLDAKNSALLLQEVYKLLSPGGQLVLYESNPWNVLLKLRRFVGPLFGRSDPRRLLSRTKLYELLSEIGLMRILAIYHDFVFRPLSGRLAWLLRNFSILLENMPVVQTLAGSILIYAQKPGRLRHGTAIPLFRHESLRGAVSVVVPCHNEEMNLRPLVSRLTGMYGDYLQEIILVDDNSTDETADVIRTLQKELPLVKSIIRHPPNGVGRALADGYKAATGRYVLSMDCDFTSLLPEMRDLFDAAAEGFDLVVGSRFSRHSVLLNYPFQKIVANRGFHAIARLVFRKPFRDLTNNLKLMKREVVESLRITQPHFAVNAETGLQPLLMGFSVREVPISWINRTPDMGVSSFRLAKVGGGYWRVLTRLAVETRFGFRPLKRGSVKSLPAETHLSRTR